MWSPFLKRNAIQATIFFAAYYIAGVLGQATTNIRSSNIGPVWPAYGVALAAFLVCGYRVWPAIALGAFVVALSSPVTPLAALGQAAGATLAAFSGAYLLYRILKFDSSLSRLRDALALVLLGALGSSLVSATIGVFVLYATHVHAYSGPGSAWLIYWLGDSTGVLLVTPLVLTFPTLFRIRNGHRLREFALLLLLLTSTSFAAFGLLPLTPSRVHHMAFAVLPFVMWAAIRFGMSVTALSIFLLSTIATVETALGAGPFTTNTPLMNALLLDIFFGVVSVTGLSLAAVVAEREHAEGERERLVRERAEAEARLRFAAIVESCEDAIISGTLDGIIVSWNGGAQRIYGYTEAEAVGKPIALLLPPELADEENKILETLRAEGRIEHFETVRVTKTGKRINVSLTISAIRDSSGRTVGISGIARDITERKRAEEALVDLNRTLEAQSALLQSSEELLKIFVKNVPAAVAMLDRDMCYLQVSDRWCTDYLPGRAQILGRSHYEIFPDMPERWKEVHRLCLEGETLRADEDRWDGKDGPHWARWEVRPWKTAEGTVGGILILAEDITRRKQMEETLSTLSRTLIDSQEQERARIGRELHDDINQRLAMLTLELEQLQESPSEVQNRVQELRKQTTEIANDVQALSHELHSSKLEYLGVVAGMKSWCKEFAERHKVEIDFKNDVPSVIPIAMGVSLFRVLQEALHNALKHSGVKRIEVQVREDSGEIHLIVSDSGKGFDLDAALQGRGLGLTSMRERVRLVNGTILIESKPMGGTRIHVRVPFESDHPQKAAG